MLQLDQINPQIRDIIKISVLNEIIYKPAFLVNRLLITNRTTKSLQVLRKQIKRNFFYYI
jgi:hypothetical protein